jgi:hypothetical protein
MGDRRRSRIVPLLKRIGKALVDGLTAMGSCSCAGIAMSSGMRMGSRRSLDDHGDAEIQDAEHGDAEIQDQAERGIAKIEAYLASVERPSRRPDQSPRQRRRDSS